MGGRRGCSRPATSIRRSRPGCQCRCRIVQFRRELGQSRHRAAHARRRRGSVQSFLTATSLWNREPGPQPGRRPRPGGRLSGARPGLSSARPGQLAVRAYSEAIAIYPATRTASPGAATRWPRCDCSTRRSPTIPRRSAGPVAFAGVLRPRCCALRPGPRRAGPRRPGPRHRTRPEVMPRPTATEVRSTRGAARTSWRSPTTMRSSLSRPRTPGRTRTAAGSWCGSARFDRALKDLDDAIRLDPKRATAYQNRGAAYNGLGQYRARDRRPEQGDRARP